MFKGYKGIIRHTFIVGLFLGGLFLGDLKVFMYLGMPHDSILKSYWVLGSLKGV